MIVMVIVVIIIVICTVFLQVYSIICMISDFNPSLIYVCVVACVYINSDLNPHNNMGTIHTVTNSVLGTIILYTEEVGHV